MSEIDLENYLAVAYEPAQQPLGQARRASGQLRQGESAALHEATDNLLKKATQRLADGRTEAAQALIRRALALGLDEFEQVLPALTEPGMLFFQLVDDLLPNLDKGDPIWLDSLEGVYQLATDVTRAEMRGMLVAVQESLELSRPELQRVRAIIDAGGPEGRLEEMTDAPEAEQVEAITDVLRAIGRWRGILVALLEADNWSEEDEDEFDRNHPGGLDQPW